MVASIVNPPSLPISMIRHYTSVLLLGAVYGFVPAGISACDLRKDSPSNGEATGEPSTFDPMEASGETSPPGSDAESDGTDSGGTGVESTGTEGSGEGTSEVERTCTFLGSGSGPDCDTCIAGNCCDEISLCEEEIDCACALVCFAEAENAPDPARCFEECGISEFPAAFNGIFMCRNEVCAATCDTGNDSATTGPMPPDDGTGTGN